MRCAARSLPRLRGGKRSRQAGKPRMRSTARSEQIRTRSSRLVPQRILSDRAAEEESSRDRRGSPSRTRLSRTSRASLASRSATSYGRRFSLAASVSARSEGSRCFRMAERTPGARSSAQRGCCLA
jgi:hypothetical protein